jgi:hypothetical protein
MRTKPTLLGATLAMFFSSSLALANDVKLYSGSSCHSGGGETYDNTYGSVDDSGTFYCPIIRDNTTNTNGLADVDVYVHNAVADGVNSGLSCTVLSFTNYGSLNDYNYVFAMNAGDRTLDFNTTVSVSVNGSGSYTMICNLSDGDRLYGYRVDEF